MSYHRCDAERGTCHTWDMSHVRHATHENVTWEARECGGTRTCQRHVGSYETARETCHIWDMSHPRDMPHMRMSHMNHVSRVTMGWLWLVGSFKTYVAFAEHSLFYRALLEKRPMFLGILLIVANPYLDVSNATTWEARQSGGTRPRQRLLAGRNCDPYLEWVTLHIRMGHITRMDASCHACEFGCHTCEYGTSQACIHSYRVAKTHRISYLHRFFFAIFFRKRAL